MNKLIDDILNDPTAKKAFDFLVEISAKEKTIPKVETYSYWENPYNFEFKGDSTHKNKNSISIVRGAVLRFFYEAIGGRGYAIWNKEFISGNKISLKFYLKTAHAKINKEHLLLLKNIKILDNELNNLNILTQKINTTLKDYEDNILESARAFLK